MIFLTRLTAFVAIALLGACAEQRVAPDPQAVAQSLSAQCAPQPAINGQITTCQVRIPVSATTAGASGGILILQRRYLSPGMDTALLPEASRLFNEIQAGFIPPQGTAGSFVLHFHGSTTIVPLENGTPGPQASPLTTKGRQALSRAGLILPRDDAKHDTQGYVLDRRVMNAAVSRLSVAYRAIAGADTKAWLARLGTPTEITPVEQSCSKPWFPMSAWNEAREGLDVSRCAVSQDGTIGPCTSLRSLGGNDFTEGNHSFLNLCHARSKGTAPMPFHDFQTVFGFGD